MSRNHRLLGSILFSVLLLSGCPDSAAPPYTGGGDGAPIESDGGGGPAVDGTIGTELGWVTDDGGVVKLSDGAVLIGADAGNAWVCYPTTCAGKLLDCGDCLDNDGDGKVDSHDLECLGPCDNTEGPALIAGVGGGGGATCKVDCYFDFGNGPGNDNCIWDHQCDPLAPEANLGCSFDQAMANDEKKCPSTQSQTCSDSCLPYTPNGCDCFGCCTFPELKGKGEGGADGFVWIGAMDSFKQGTCTFADVLDETKCPRCTPIAGCYNECGHCEVCIGKPLPPPECFPGPDGGVDIPDGGSPAVDGGVPPISGQCPMGITPCGLEGQASCPSGYYCISGCCKEVNIK